MEDRPAILLRGIGRGSKLLELGPSMSPMAPRSQGWNVTVVDHATQQELIEKYKNDVHVDVRHIEHVDHVWRGGPLHEAIPAELHGSFDVLIASHVIEHIPDPVRFFESARRLLQPGHGILALALPDKRWCFDALKQVSTTGQILEAYLQRRQRHTAATRFDASAYVAFDGDRTSWGREPLPGLYLPDTLDHAFQEFQAWSPSPDATYVDCHAWHFTPASFELNILELASCGLCDWHIDWLMPRPTVEFFTRLRPGAESFASPQERDRKRLALLKQILLELREQVDCLANDRNSIPLTDDAARQDLHDIATMLRSTPGLQAQAGVEAVSTMQRPERTSQEQMERDWRQVVEVAGMMHTALRPPRAIWRHAMPLRRAIARWRGRA